MADEFEASRSIDDDHNKTFLQITKYLKVKRLIDDCTKEDGKKYFKVQWEDSWIEYDLLHQCCPKELELYSEQGKPQPQNVALTPTENGHVIVKLEELHQHLKDSIDFKMNSRLVAYSQLEKAGFHLGVDENNRTLEGMQSGVQEGNENRPNPRAQMYWQAGGIDAKLSHFNNIVTNNVTMAETSKRQYGQRRKQPLQLYRCETCGAEFVHRTHLKIHQRTHTGEKPYKCEFCGKCFAQKGNLHVHMKTHTGVKEFVCDFCHRAFVTNAQLLVHVRTHVNPNRKKSANASTATINKNNMSAGNPIKPPESGNNAIYTICNPVMSHYGVPLNSKYVASKTGPMEVHAQPGKIKSPPGQIRNLESMTMTHDTTDPHRVVHKVTTVGNLPTNFHHQSMVKSQLTMNGNNVTNSMVLAQENNIYDIHPSVTPLVNDANSTRHSGVQ